MLDFRRHKIARLTNTTSLVFEKINIRVVTHTFKYAAGGRVQKIGTRR